MTDEATDEQENLTRRERRARAKGGDSDQESVKDRNQRLRNEAAGRRRAARRAERDAAAATGLDAGERVDDALTRSADATGRFVRDNFAWLQWIILAGVAAAIAILIVDYRREVSAQKRGHRVEEAVSAEVARVASSEPAPQGNLVDRREEFSTAKEKNENALKGWKKLAKSESKALSLIAKLGVANSLFDLQKYAEAREAYQSVEKSPSAASQLELRARAIEGMGLSYEAEKKYAEAKEAFKKLGNLDDFTDLSQFHLARVEFLTGDREAAMKLLRPLDEKLSKDAGPEGPTDYLGAAVRDLLKTVDPAVAAAELAELKRKQEAEQQERFRKMLEEMQKNSGKDGGAPLNIPGLPQSPPSKPTTAPATPSKATTPTPPTPTPSKATPAPATPSAPAQNAPATPPVASGPSKAAPDTSAQTPTPAPGKAAPETAPAAPAPAPTAPAEDQE